MAKLNIELPKHSDDFKQSSGIGAKVNISLPNQFDESGIPVITNASLVSSKVSNVRRLDYSSYTKYTPADQIDISLDTPYLDEQRAQNQSALQLIGNSAAQLGATILGGTITGVGAIVAFPELAYEGIYSLIDEDHDIDWNSILKEGLSGGLYQLGIGIEEGVGESNPIYLTQRASDANDSFFDRLGDATYWASMTPTIGSAVASVIPVTGALKGVALAGKAMQGIRAASALGKTAGKIGRVLRGRRASQIMGTILGTHLDSIEEIARSYDEQFEYAKSLGFNDDEAARYAGDYASYSYRNGIISNAATNFIEWGVLTKGLDKVLPDVNKLHRATNEAARGFARGGRDFESKTIEEALRASETGLSVGKRALIKSADYFKVSLTEGLEEMNMDFALSEGERSAKLNIGIEEDPMTGNVVERYKTYLSKNSTWDSFLWGAIGGVASTSGRSLITKVLRGKETRAREEAAYNATLDAIRNVVRVLSDYKGDISAYIDENGEVADPARNILIPIFSALARANAFEQGEIMLNELANMTEDEINSIYGVEGQRTNKKKIIEFLRSEYEVAKKMFNKNSSTIFSNKWNTPIAINMFVNDYLKDYYIRQRNILEGQLVELNSQYNTTDPNIESQIEMASARIKSFNTEIEELTKQLSAQQQIIDDYESIINSEEIKKLRNKNDKRLLELEKLLRDSEAELEDLNSKKKDARQSYREVAKLLRDSKSKNASVEEISNLEEEVNRLQNEYENAKREYKSKQRKKYRIVKQYSDYAFANSITSKELNAKITQNKIARREADRIKQLIETIKNRKNEYIANHPEEAAAYNEAIRIRDQRKVIESEKIRDLKQMLDVLNFAIAKHNNVENNRDEIVREQEAAYDEIERISQEQDRAQQEYEEQEKEDEEQDSETDEEIDNVLNTEIKQASDGSNYTVDKDGKVISFTHDNSTLNIGDRILHNGKEQVIEDVTVDDKGNVQVKLSEESNPINKSDIKQHKLSPKTVGSLNDIRFKLNKSLFNNDFEEGLKAILDILESDDFKNGFNTNSNSLQVISDRLDTMKEIRELIESQKPDNISESAEEARNKIDNIIRTTNTANQILYRRALAFKLISDILNINLDSYGEDINNDFQSNYLEPFIQSVAEYMNLISDATPNGFLFNRPEFRDAFMSDMKNMIDQFKTKLANDFYVKYNIEDTNPMRIEINENLNAFHTGLGIQYTNSVIKLLNSYKGVRSVFLQNIKHILDNKNKNKTEFDLLRKVFPDNIVEVLEKIDKLVDDYANGKLVVDQEVIKELADIRTFTDKILNPESELIKSLTEEEQKLFSRLGIREIAYTSNQTLDVFNIQSKINQEENINEDNILHAVNTLIASFAINDNIASENIDYRNDKYGSQDVEYYLSDAERTAYKALNEIINRFTELQIYVPNHKVTFEDILSVIYSQPNGKQQVEEMYRNLYYVINTVLDNNRIEQIKSLIKNNIVKEAVYKPFFNMFDNIQNRIANPKTTINPKYIQPNGELTNEFITYFEKNYTPREWASDVKNGVVIPNNEIFNHIKRAVDPKTRVVASEVEIDGQKFTIEELIQAEQSLHSGVELATKISEDGQVIDLFTTVNGKELKVGEIRIDRGYTYHGMALTRQASFDSDSYIFDSWIGTASNLSENVDIIISNVVRNTNVFNAVKDFVLEYEKRKALGRLSTEEGIETLKSMLNDIQEAGLREGTDISPIYNAILNCVNYNTNSEVEQDIDLGKVYMVLNPIFYNIPREHVNDLLRDGEKIRLRYNALRNRLIANFQYTDRIRRTYQDNPSASIIITHVDKPSFAFASRDNVRNGVKENIPTSIEVDGRQQVQIVTTQDISSANKSASDPYHVYSSLTDGKRVTDQSIIDKLNRSTDGIQLYAVVRSNNGPNGTSIIPLRRTSARFDLGGDIEYGKAAVYHITDTFKRIMSDRFLTYLSTKPSKSMYQATQAQQQSKNAEYEALINDLSETVIVDNLRESDIQLPWFEVSGLYKNTTRNGDMYFAKDITFIANDLVGDKYFGKRSYGYKIRVIYEYNTVENTPSKISRIEISRVATKQGRIPETTVVDRNGTKVQTTAWTKGLTRGQIKSIIESGFSVNDTRSTNISIDMRGKDLATLLNTKGIQSIFGNMIRAVNTVDGNCAKSYTSEASGASFGQSLNQQGITNGRYTSVALTKLKMAGLYNGKTTFDSLQDFYLETGAVTTGAVGTITESGKVVSMTNYGERTPNIYVDIKEESNNVNINDAATMAQTDKARMILKAYSSNENTQNVNSFNRLIQDGNLNRDTLISFGLVTEETPIDQVDEYISFLTETFKDKQNAPLLFIDSYEDAVKLIGDMTLEQFKARRGEYIKSKNAIVIYNNVFTQYKSPIEILGRTLLHETLHYRIINDLKNRKVKKGIVDDINKIIDVISDSENTKNLTEKERALLNKYLEAIKAAGNDAYTELISYTFSEPAFALILNKIQSPIETTQERSSIWNKILDILLDILGIKEVQKGSALEQLRNTIVNNISLRSGVVRINNSSLSRHPSPTGGLTNESSTIEQSKPKQKIKRKLITNTQELQENKDIVDPFDNIDTDGIAIEGDIDLDDLMALDVTEDRLAMPPVGEGQRDISNPILNSPRDFVYLSTETTPISVFRENYIDKDGLKLC